MGMHGRLIKVNSFSEVNSIKPFLWIECHKVVFWVLETNPVEEIWIQSKPQSFIDLIFDWPWIWEVDVIESEGEESLKSTLISASNLSLGNDLHLSSVVGGENGLLLRVGNILQTFLQLPILFIGTVRVGFQIRSYFLSRYCRVDLFPGLACFLTERGDIDIFKYRVRK